MIKQGSHLLQSIIFPTEELSLPTNLYFVADGNVLSAENGTALSVRFGSKVCFNTFFNGISVGVWKRNCSLENMSYILKGQGKFLIRVGLINKSSATDWMQSDQIELNSDGVRLDIRCWPAIVDGIIFLELTATEDCTFSGGALVTNSAPINNVKLGIVVTHYNRKQYVLPAIKRLRTQLLEDPLYQNSVSLVVIDNSNNISAEEVQGAVLIPNINLGGSGGFMRGLLYLKDNEFTHCLFMDDDASCEVESIRRTFAIFQFSHIERFSMSGSLLLENSPVFLYEKGACFDGVVRPLKHGLDMTNPNDLLKAEQEEKIEYGAWWFFGFKISDVRNFAFPFFVRGDDIQFGISNKFNVETMNGVACWGEDFSYKSSPLTRYLDVRNHLLQALAIKKKSHFRIALLLLRFFISSLMSYNYASTKSTLLAIKHVSEGPHFWTANLDMKQVFSQVAEYAGSEFMMPFDQMKKPCVKIAIRNSWFKRIMIVVTLNGFLLPYWLFSEQIICMDKSKTGHFGKIFLFKHVFYFNPFSRTGYLASHDKRQIMQLIAAFASLFIQFFWKIDQIEKSYQEGMLELTSEQFWRDVYQNQDVG